MQQNYVIIAGKLIFDKIQTFSKKYLIPTCFVPFPSSVSESLV